MPSIWARLNLWIARLFRGVTAVILFALMILTCTDVIGRYYFNRPVYGGLELTEILLAGMIFSALPMVSYRSSHIVIDLVKLPSPLLRTIQHLLVNLACSATSLVLAQQLWIRAQRLGRAGETTIQIKIPLDIVTYSISGLLALTAVAFLVRAFIPGSHVNPATEPLH